MNREEKMIVALTGSSHALSHAYLLIFPAVLLLLKEEFSMGYLGLGVIGNVMIFAYGLGALPGGMIYNRFGPKKLYLFCFLGSAAVSLLIAAAPNFLLFTAGLAVLGAVGSVYHPLANSLITAKVKEYSHALGIHGAAGNVGVGLAPFLAGLIASRWGWRYAYLFFVVPGIALAVWSLFIDMNVSRGPRPEAAQETSATGPRARSFLVFFSLPLLLLYAMNMLNSFAYHGSVTFLPALMAKRTAFHIFSLDSLAIGGMLSGIALLVGVFGQYAGGIWGQKPYLDRNVLRVTIAVIPFTAAMTFGTDFLLLLPALAFFFLVFCLQPMTNVLVAHYTTLKMRGTAYGIFFFAAFGLGSAASSFSGYIAQNFGLPWVFLGLAGTGVVLAAASFFLLKVKKPVYDGA